MTVTDGGVRVGSTISRNFNGRFAEIIIYDRALSDTEIDQVENYLACKWKPALGVDCPVITGTVFIDNGSGISAVAHNGEVEGDEASLAGATIHFLNSEGLIIETAETYGDGAFTFPVKTELLLEGVTIAVTLPDGKFHHISSQSTPFTDTTANDGRIDFSIIDFKNYTDINFGVVQPPILDDGREITLQAGGTYLIPHRVTSYSDMSVQYSIESIVEAVPGVISLDGYHDVNCNEQVDPAENLLSGSYVVPGGSTSCTVVRVLAASNTPVGATLTYSLRADLLYTGTSYSELLIAPDKVTIAELVSMLVTKEVCNETSIVCSTSSGAGFAVTNTGDPGDILQYRIKVSNLAENSINSLSVSDYIPSYTQLNPSTIEIISSPTGMSCNLAEPSDQSVSNYSGVVKWDCVGPFSPNGEGIFAYEVVIDQ